MPNIIFNIPLYFTGITTYTELSPKLTATASVAQSVERWSRDPGSRVQFPAGGLGVACFPTGPSWVLKCTVYLSDRLVKKTRLRLVFSTCLSVFRNQRKNTFSCLNYYVKSTQIYYTHFKNKSKYRFNDFRFLFRLTCFIFRLNMTCID